jgi:hypothetical protein
MPQPVPQKLTCSQCGFENEPERVYCHNCGTKLDRSLLPKDTTSAEDNLAASRKRIKKMTNPGKGWTEVKTGFNTLVWAVLVAALYLLFSPPERPPLTRDKEAGANLISVMIEDALGSPAAGVLQFSEADISQHMRTRVKAVEVIPLLEFKRAYARLDDGQITVGVEQDVFGITTVCSSVDYQLKVIDGQFVATKVGQHFGRLGFDPRIPKVDSIFQPLWAAMKREKPLIDRVQQVTITKDRVVVALKAAAPAPR